MVIMNEWTTKDVARQVNGLLKDDWDAVTVIDGIEGVGKSTLSFIINMEQNGKNFEVKKNVLFYPNIDDINDRYDNGKKYSGYQWDEAMLVLYKLNWASKGQKNLNTKFAVIRSENKATYLCIPRFRDLNEYFRNHRVRTWIHVIERGIAVVKSRDWNEYAPDPWHWDDNYRLIKKYQGRKSLSQFSTHDILKVEAKTIGFEGVLYFDKCEGELWDEYLQLKKDRRVEMDTAKELDTQEEVCHGLIAEGITDINKLMTLCKRSKRQIQRYVVNYDKCRSADTILIKDKVLPHDQPLNMLGSRESRKHDSKVGEKSEEIPN